MKPRSRTIAAAIIVVAGAAVAANGFVAGPHAFGSGWYSVGGIAVAGLLLMTAGAAILRSAR